MRKIKVVVLLVRQLQHGFTKNAKVSPNLTVTHRPIACRRHGRLAELSLNIMIEQNLIGVSLFSVYETRSEAICLWQVERKYNAETVIKKIVADSCN